MKSKWEKRLVALVLCMVVAISNSSFIFASETVEADYSQEAEVQTESEPVADDAAAVAAYEEEAQPAAEEQPTVEEPATEEPVAVESEEPAPAIEEQPTETPATEEPAAEEPATVANEEETLTAEEPANEEQTAAEEEPAQEETAQQLTWSAKVGDATVNVTAEAGALPEDAQLSVSEITSEKEVEEIEKAVEKKAIEEQFSIENILSYDIKFLVNGSEVQPTTPVQVSVDTPQITADQDAAVLHVDDNNVAEDMKGSVDGEGNVVFDAPHFSTYVIVNRGGAEVEIKLQHYYYDTNNEEKQLYADQTVTLPVGSKIEDYRKSTNYDVLEVKEIAEDGTKTAVSNFNEIQVTGNKTYRIYYQENKSTVQGAVKFWDYDIKGNNNINSGSHYSRGNVKSTTDYLGNYTNRMTMGTKSANGLSNYNAYGTNSDTSGKKLNANVCNYGRDTNGKGTLGLLAGLSEDYQTVLWNVDQPGFFTDDYQGEGKTIYTNYKLKLERSGNHYTLKSVVKPDGTEENAGPDNKLFFPLGNQNYYFGMRYDVEFTLGDYVGPLDYDFTGDDDLWVLLDGEVVIDVGGIHNALNGTVDLWEALGYKNGARPDPNDTTAKNETHRITVLYMERGAGQSNCSMEFTLPNSRVLDVTEVPKATLSLKKVSSQGVAIPGAVFKLVSDADENDFSEVTSDENGLVTFPDLKEGTTYTLTEKSAPDDYVAETTIWQVKLERNDSGDLQAVLYNGDEALTLDEDGTYHIVNYTQDELVSKSVESNKTVSVLDWDERTYTIDLTASSKVTQSTTVAVPYDIVLVLDTSGSMGDDFVEYQRYTGDLQQNGTYYIKTANGIYQKLKGKTTSSGKGPNKVTVTTWSYKDTYTGQYVTVTQGNAEIYTAKSTKSSSKLNALKTAAKNFVDTVATKNPDNRVSVVSFAGYYTDTPNATIKETEGGKTLLRVGNSKQKIDGWINELNAKGSTHADSGLKSAISVLKEETKWEDVDQNTGRKKLVVFFTDGVPTDFDEFDSTMAANAIGYSTTLQTTYKASVYALGVFDAADSDGNIQKGTVKQIDDYMKGVASSDEMYMTADSVNNLSGLFDSITNNMAVAVKGTITDVVDSRFKVLNEDALRASGASITNNADGTTTITWKDVDIQGAKDTGATANDRAGWHQSIIIKAKDDFIGGNMIPTNGAASGITVDGSTKKFPRPSVNVKLLTMSLKDEETTVYKGDPITPEAYADELTQALKIIELKENNPTTTVGIAPKDANGNPMFPALSDDQKNALANGKSITLGTGEEYKYIYPGTTDAIGYFEYAFNGTENLGDHEAVKVGDKVEKYTVEVKFIPYSTANRQNRVSGVNVPNEAGGSNHNLEPITTTGTYTVNVIAGEIQIVKKVDKASEQDREFTFVITKDGELYKEVTVTVEKNKTEGTYTGNDLKELPRGTYVVSEKLTSGYGVKEFSVVSDITNCQNSVDDAKDTATFVMGNNISEKDVIAEKDYKNGILAKVIYTNEEVIAQWNVIKRSSSSTEEAALYLGGAEFTLTSKDGTVYKGVSTEETGVVIWKKDGKEIECNELPAGTYTLEETKAPQGYSLSREKWTIVLTKHGKLKTITSSTGKDIVKFEQQDGKISYYYDNTPIYDLPSTGHTGIFHVMMSGILLMFAGILIIFKMRSKGVLKR